tara:strand:- start:870 stop:2417 length:1548 start_codon:yes stop_codon:yes gene_type:complete
MLNYEITINEDSTIQDKIVTAGTTIIVVNVSKTIHTPEGTMVITFGPSGGLINIEGDKYPTPPDTTVSIKGGGTVVLQDLEAIILMRLHGKKGDKLTQEQQNLIKKRLTVIESVEPGEKAYTPDNPELPNLVMEEIKRGYKQIQQETKDALKEKETGDVLMTSVDNIDTLFAEGDIGKERREELKKFLEHMGYKSFTDVTGKEVESTLNFKLWEPDYDWLHGDPNYRGEILLFYVFILNRATGDMTYVEDLYPKLRDAGGGRNLPKTASAFTFSLLEFAQRIERGEFVHKNIPIKHAKIIDLSCQSYAPIVHQTQFTLMHSHQQSIIINMIRNCFPKETGSMDNKQLTSNLTDIFYTTNHYKEVNNIGSVAFARLIDEYIEVHTLCVDKDHRGKSLCDKLMSDIIGKYGAKELRLKVRVTPVNKVAWKCYENRGFKLVLEESSCTPTECTMIRPAGGVWDDANYKNTFFLDQLDNDGNKMRASDIGYSPKLLTNKKGITKSLWVFCDNLWKFYTD